MARLARKFGIEFRLDGGFWRGALGGKAKAKAKAKQRSFDYGVCRARENARGPPSLRMLWGEATATAPPLPQGVVMTARRAL